MSPKHFPKLLQIIVLLFQTSIDICISETIVWRVSESKQNDQHTWIIPLRVEALVMQVHVEHWGYCVPSFISLISSLCHQLIICACQGSDTLDSLHAVGEQGQDDDTLADSADLAAGQRCKLHSHRPSCCTSGNRFNRVHCEALQHLIPLCLNMLFYATVSDKEADKKKCGRADTCGHYTCACTVCMCVCLHVCTLTCVCYCGPQ